MMHTRYKKKNALLPCWDELFANAHPEPEHEHEPGSFGKGWQQLASNSRSKAELFEFLSFASPEHCALLRTQSGRLVGRCSY